METVFITIHDLSPDARIKYCSDSIEYILGYLPHEVKGKSCWDYFHPDEIPFGKMVHDKGLGLDKAAVFSYCRVRHKDGTWIGCECVFTVVYDILIASTAIYQRGFRSQKRAIDGAYIRRTFATAPRDSRYHMLSYISDRFHQEPQPHGPEPRAALFLNRFTRTSAIMFATNGVKEILGVEPSQLVGESFYYCIAQNCLDDAIRCLESAKANDSIAYLRFWFRDPTSTPDLPALTAQSIPFVEDEDQEDGGVSVGTDARTESKTPPESHATPGASKKRSTSTQESEEQHDTKELDTIAQDRKRVDPAASEPKLQTQSRSSSDESAQAPSESVFDPPGTTQKASTTATTPAEERSTIELEAVISCTSDGLIVILRRARSLAAPDTEAKDRQYYARGLFASPWAPQPILPEGVSTTDITKATSDAPSRNTDLPSFMDSIRNEAVFAWSLTSINGELVDHARGQPTGEALPPGGVPVWDTHAKVDAKNEALWNGFADSTHRPTERPDQTDATTAETIVAGNPLDSSDDEILWKRVPEQPAWRKPARRAYSDAFEDDSRGPGEDGESQTRATKSRRKF